MAKKSFEVLTETMFYVLMSFLKRNMCGIEIAAFIRLKTNSRVSIGPGTLYAILAKFEEEGMIIETEVVGRKRTYKLSEKGFALYETELERLKACITDAEREERL